ncbi:hypothetical protein THIOSC13_540009 [uncultured Thiomicrorhabdus sp.]
MNSIAMNQSYFVSLRTLHPVGKFFIAIFLIVLFEGAIRKWVWGGATIPLLGLRDLIVVGAVFWGILPALISALGLKSYCCFGRS